MLLIGAWIFAATVLNQSAVHWRANAVDDHLFAWHGWCVAQGARPYLDIWDNKPPGIWWLNAAAFTLVGEGVAAEMLVCAPAVAIALAALVGIARCAFHPSLAIPAALIGGALLLHPILEFGGNRTETYVVACETVTVWAFLRGVSGGGRGWYFLAGLAAGAAPLFKQSGLGAIVACTATLGMDALLRQRAAEPAALHPRRALGLMALAAVLPLAGAGGVLAWHGALAAAWHAVVTFNRAYFAVDDATWVRMGDALAVYRPVLVALAGFLALAALGGTLSLSLAVRRTSPIAPAARRAIPLLIIWFLIDAYLACVGPGRRGYHFLPAVPALALLALVPLHFVAGRNGLVASCARRSGAIVVLLIYGLIAADVMGVQAAELQRCWGQKRAWWRLERDPLADYEAQAGEVRRCTIPTDEIYVWGWSPGTYRFAYRRCPSRFATLEKLGQVGEHAAFIRAGAMADIVARPPRLFIISSGDWQAMSTLQSAFAAWLAQTYSHRVDVSGMKIFERGGPRIESR